MCRVSQPPPGNTPALPVAGQPAGAFFLGTCRLTVNKKIQVSGRHLQRPEHSYNFLAPYFLPGRKYTPLGNPRPWKSWELFGFLFCYSKVLRPPLPNPTDAASLGLGLALGIVAGLAQALHVAIVIGATFGQGNGVVALGGQRDAPLRMAFNAQRLTGEQRCTHGLQLPASHAPGGVGWLCPGLLRMLGAAACAVAYQRSTARVSARFGRSSSSLSDTSIQKSVRF